MKVVCLEMVSFGALSAPADLEEWSPQGRLILLISALGPPYGPPYGPPLLSGLQQLPVLKTKHRGAGWGALRRSLAATEASCLRGVGSSWAWGASTAFAACQLCQPQPQSHFLWALHSLLLLVTLVSLPASCPKGPPIPNFCPHLLLLG